MIFETFCRTDGTTTVKENSARLGTFTRRPVVEAKSTGKLNFPMAYGHGEAKPRRPRLYIVATSQFRYLRIERCIKLPSEVRTTVRKEAL